MVSSSVAKSVSVALALLLGAALACAEEPAAGEHEAKKPPPKPSAAPVGDVLRLPAVKRWTKWVASYGGSSISAWGEDLNVVEGQTCWEVAVGETYKNGKRHVWRKFCVPQGGGEIWVESNSADPNADITYLPYDKWVEQCKPTEKSDGSC